MNGLHNNLFFDRERLIVIQSIFCYASSRGFYCRDVHKGRWLVMNFLVMVFMGAARLSLDCRQVVQYLAPEARTLGLLRAKLKEADVWTEHIGLSNQLRARCNAYFTEVWLRHTGPPPSSIPTFEALMFQPKICTIFE